MIPLPASPRILIPRFDAYGDLVLLQGFLGRLMQHWPNAALHLLVRRRYAELAPLCSPKLTWHTTEMEPITVLPRPLREQDDIMPLLGEPWDLMLGTTFNRTWLDDNIAALLASRNVACVRLAKAGESRNGANGMSVAVPEATHETEKYQVLFETLSGDGSPLPDPRLKVRDAIEAEVRVYLKDSGLEAGGYIACVPGGALNNPLNRWHAAGFAECVANAERQYGIPAIFIGHQAEANVVSEAWREARRLGANSHMWIGDHGSIEFLAGLLGLSRAYLGGDTGPMHMAQALGRPAAGVFGGWTWPRFTPAGPGMACVAPMACFGCGSHCLYGDAPCISSVRTNDVYAALRRVLDGNAPAKCETIESPSKVALPAGELAVLAREFRTVSETAGNAHLLNNSLAEHERYVAILQDQGRQQEQLIARLRSESQDLHSESQNLHSEIQRLQSDIHNLRSEIPNLQFEVQRLQSECRTLEEQRSAAVEEMNREVSRLQAAWREDRSSLDQARISLEQERACRNRDRQAAETEISQLTQQVSAAFIDRDALKAEHARVLEEHSRLLQEERGKIESLRADPFRWLVESNARAANTLQIEGNGQPGLVSVVIPMFNGAAFAERCLHSVWNQKLPAGYSIEILACDDGSKDSSKDLVAHLAANSPIPIQLLAHPNGVNLGVSSTRNLGIAHAKGQFIALLDVDDAWLPYKLEMQLSYFEQHPEAHTVCSYGYTRDLSGKPVPGWNGSEIAGDYTHVPPPNDLTPPYTFELLMRGDPIVNSTVMMRRRALAAVGGYTAVMAHQAEDWLLFLKLSLSGPLHLIPEPLIDYLVHPSSYTSQYFAFDLSYGARIETLYQLLHWMLQHPDHRTKAQWVYRRYLPSLLSSKSGAYRLIEDYYRFHNGNTDGVSAFEAHLCGVRADMEQLRAYKQHIEAQLDLLRGVPGVVPAYHLARSLYRRVRR